MGRGSNRIYSTLLRTWERHEFLLARNIINKLTSKAVQRVDSDSELIDKGTEWQQRREDRGKIAYRLGKQS